MLVIRPHPHPRPHLPSQDTLPKPSPTLLPIPFTNPSATTTTMGRISQRHTPPETPQLGLLSAHIAELTALSDHTTAIPKLAALVPRLTGSLSSTGERLVQHEAYQGSGNLNLLAQTWMRQGSRCKQLGAPLRLRLQQNALKGYFTALYERTDGELERSRAAWWFAGFREFSLTCSHCVGHPWAAFTHPTMHVSMALYFEEGEYRRIWGEDGSRAGLSGMSGEGEERKMTRWKRATVEQLEEAVGRGVD